MIISITSGFLYDVNIILISESKEPFLMITLTFDTSVRINAFQTVDDSTSLEMKAKIHAAKRLLDAHIDGLIEISYNEGEVAYENLHSLKSTNGPWILGTEGFSILGKSTMLGGDDKLIVAVKKIVNPQSTQNMKDFAILENHIVFGRDIFVSEDRKKHLNKSAKLALLGIKVKSAVEAVDYLRRLGILK